MENENLSMRGKRVAVTGAGSGIGKAAALAFAQRGASVALIGKTANELTETFEMISSEDSDHLRLAADISNEEQLHAAMSAIKAAWGSLDTLVANAGVNGLWAPLDEITLDEWQKTLAVNLTGTFLTLRSAVPLLRVHGGAAIIVASINGTRIFSNSGATAYACSKAGQVALTKMTALELAPHKIRVNVVCPGAIKTNIDSSTERKNVEDLHLPVNFPDGDVPLTGGIPGSADDVAGAIVFLASDDASHITGSELYVDGAQSLLQG